MKPKQYAAPAAFKQALEQRLRDTTTGGSNLTRQRQILVFDRFLARVVHVFRESVTLKGGLVLEIRLEHARTTNDVDLALNGEPDQVLAQFQAAGRLDLGDFMTFEVILDPDHPAINNPGMKYDGIRFRARCTIASKIYGQPFGVDVAFGDPMIREPETSTLTDTLAFAGIAAPTVRIYPVETHIAEKLHAYTMPRPTENSRVKDLPDIALLASVGPLDAQSLSKAIRQTFEHRNTHPVPTAIPQPPTSWAMPYARIAHEDGLPWKTIADVFAAVREFLDPVLAEESGIWEPTTWTWGPGSAKAKPRTA